MEKIVKTPDYVALRIDNAVIYNPEWLVNSYGKRDSGASIHFGTFTLVCDTVDENVNAIKKAVAMLTSEGAIDTIFDGQYPKVVKEEQYGWKIKTNNKTNFFEKVGSTEPMTDIDDIASRIWDLELHLSLTKRNEIFLTVPRAIARRKKGAGASYENDLFSDNETVEEKDIFS